MTHHPESSHPASSSDGHEVHYVALLNLLAVAQIALYCGTSLWVGPFTFPQIPLIHLFRELPAELDFVAFLASLAGTWFARSSADKFTRRLRHAVCALSLLVLFGFNQHRLQPWAWQFCVLHAWLATAPPEWKLRGWRWLMISIYLYSAASKLDYAFCVQHGPFLWDGFLQAMGVSRGTAAWPGVVRGWLAFLMPVTELTAGSCLCFSRTQRFGVRLSMVMHAFLLIALGPWGHNHSAGVLIWNLFFIAQNWLLFPGGVVAPTARPQSTTSGNPLPTLAWPRVRTAAAGLILACALLAPLGEPWGLWDHWPSWSVYSARPERVTVLVHEEELELLPRELRPPESWEPWRPIRLDRWSLEAARVPILPQSRFQLGVALKLARQHGLTQLRVTIESPPHRWTGRRTQQELIGISQVESYASRYWLNSQAR